MGAWDWLGEEAPVGTLQNCGWEQQLGFWVKCWQMALLVWTPVPCSELLGMCQLWDPCWMSLCVLSWCLASVLPPDSKKTFSAGLWALVSNVSQAGSALKLGEMWCLLTCWCVALQGSTSMCPASRLEATRSGSWAGGWTTALRTGWLPTRGTPTGGTTVRHPRMLPGGTPSPLSFAWWGGWLWFLVCFQASSKSSEERTTAASSPRSWPASPGQSSTGRGSNLDQTTNNPESLTLLTDSGLGAEPPPARDYSSSYFIKAFYLFFWLFFLIV